MNVFLSWSGSISKQLAEIFNDWLPNVLQYIKPYFSEEDIEMGEFFPENIRRKLTDYNFGLIFITEDNIESPWVNFEAGALSKDLDSRLIPLIWEAEIDVLNPSPLKQYQPPKNYERDSIYRIIQSINTVSDEKDRLSSDRLKLSFEIWWPGLKEKLDNVPKENKKKANDQSLEPVTQKEMAMYMRNIQNSIAKSNTSISSITDSKLRYMQGVIRDTSNVLDISIDSLSTVANDYMKSISHRDRINSTFDMLPIK